MPSVAEIVGRSGQVDNDKGSAELQYRVWDTTDEAAAQAAALAVSPSAHRSMPRVGSSVEETGVGQFAVSVQYSTRDVLETGESSFSFETGGGTQHVTQSLETVGSYAPDGETAPDFHGAIGVTEKSVQGVDISVPVYKFSETHYIAAAAVTQAYKLTLHSLTATVNNATFRGFAAGVVLFEGASGSQRGVDDWEITFRFAASENVTGLTIGDISGIDKGGWDYLWVRYREVKDAAAGRIVRRPAAVYVERVMEWGNFANLGI